MLLMPVDNLAFSDDLALAGMFSIDVRQIDDLIGCISPGTPGADRRHPYGAMVFAALTIEALVGFRGGDCIMRPGPQ